VDETGVQQLIDQTVAFGTAGNYACADSRSTHLHVWGGLPEDLFSHVHQHRESLGAHLPNILLHLDLDCAPS